MCENRQASASGRVFNYTRKLPVANEKSTRGLGKQAETLRSPLGPSVGFWGFCFLFFVFPTASSLHLILLILQKQLDLTGGSLNRKKTL